MMNIIRLGLSAACLAAVVVDIVVTVKSGKNSKAVAPAAAAPAQIPAATN